MQRSYHFDKREAIHFWYRANDIISKPRTVCFVNGCKKHSRDKPGSNVLYCRSLWKWNSCHGYKVSYLFWLGLQYLLCVLVWTCVHVCICACMCVYSTLQYSRPLSAGAQTTTTPGATSSGDPLYRGWPNSHQQTPLGTPSLPTLFLWSSSIQRDGFSTWGINLPLSPDVSSQNCVCVCVCACACLLNVCVHAHAWVWRKCDGGTYGRGPEGCESPVVFKHFLTLFLLWMQEISLIDIPPHTSSIEGASEMPPYSLYVECTTFRT